MAEQQENQVSEHNMAKRKKKTKKSNPERFVNTAELAALEFEFVADNIDDVEIEEERLHDTSVLDE
jgi:hypothetical protein